MNSHRSEPTARTDRWRSATGGIVTGWLIQLVVFMAVIGLIGYEAISIAITTINLEDDAREVAQAAAQAYGASRQLAVATEAAETAADELEVSLEELEEVDGSVEVAISKVADTVVVHRIGPLEELGQVSASGRARWRP